MVGLAGALSEIFDLIVLYGDLTAQELIFAFETLDISSVCRDLSRQVGTCRHLLSLLIMALLLACIGRVMPRHVATGRCRSHFFNVADVLCDRRRRDEVLVAEGSFNAPTVEMSLRTIALNAAGCSRMAGVLVAKSGLIDCESEVAVGSCRDWSRLVDVH